RRRSSVSSGKLGERCWGILPNQETFFRVSLEKHDIDWYKGKENLIWAPNKGHTKPNARKVYEDLERADAGGLGTRSEVVSALRKMGQHFADETIDLLP
ncbi:hypothetical protein, partial [Pseudomonas syringae group genomosp. 3]